MLYLAQGVPPPELITWLQSAAWIAVFTGAIIGALVGIKNLRRGDVPTQIAGQPLTIQEAQRFARLEDHRKLEARVIGLATVAAHEKLEARVMGIDEQIRNGFERIDAKRSSSIAGLHDDLETKNTSLRKEMKEDITGVHHRINDLATALGRIEGKLNK